MIILKLGEPNKSFDNNFINRNKYNFLFIFVFSILNYFLKNKENFYFLILSLFQISTTNFIGLIPSNYSPTGPWSTFIPLILCIFLQIITDYLSWINQYLIDRKENLREIKCFKKKTKKWSIIKNGKLLPGNLICLLKDEIVPADCLVVCNKLDNDNNIKISLSPLNGESTLIPKNILTKKYNLLDTNYDVKLSILDYGDKLLNHFLGYLYINNIDTKLENNIKITGKNFVPGGSIIKSKQVILFVVGCGEDKKCGGNKKDIINKINNIDKLVGKYMIQINSKILIIKVLLLTCLSIYYNFIYNSFYELFIGFFEKIIQTWIVFNSVIPFSIKIYLIIIRNLQKFYNNLLYKNIQITNSKVIDNIPQIQNIISDKTGTITKNELELSNIIFKDDEKVYKVNETFPKKIDDLFVEDNNKLNLIRCLGICIHFEEDQFKTLEDKTIREKSIYVNCIVKEQNNLVNLKIFNKKEQYNTFDINGLDFNHKKHVSSKIVKKINQDNYIIFCKGSIPEITKRVKKDEKFKIQDCDILISNYNPILRVIACAYRIIPKEEFQLNIHNENYVWEKNLIFLGLLGICDNIQENVKETIQYLKKYNINLSICTGDRAITSLAIGKEIGIFNNRKNIRELNYENINIVEQFIKLSLYPTSVFFSGIEFNKIIKDKEKYKIFQNILNQSNFIGHSLIPSMKKKLANIYKSNNKNILAIGDGYNDIDMIRVSSLGVCVKNNNNHNVMINSDIIINKFSELSTIFKLGFKQYEKNTFISKYFFLKSIFTSFLIAFYQYCNNFNLNKCLFDGITIQLINILWSSTLITYYGLNKNSVLNTSLVRINLLKYNKIVIIILFGLFLSLINSLFFYYNPYYSNYSLLITIFTFDNFINEKKKYDNRINIIDNINNNNYNDYNNKIILLIRSFNYLTILAYLYYFNYKLYFPYYMLLNLLVLFILIKCYFKI